MCFVWQHKDMYTVFTPEFNCARHNIVESCRHGFRSCRKRLKTNQFTDQL